ncbi:hypothetical protein [Betafusellovirus yellowstonense]|uniref:Uncharacterized protein n=1 Tax=Betafusellovirus yellowstonense TaxID=693629 RepID=D1GF93_9VIRU|nr:hypothetical protein SSSV1_gp09 [Acidianus spindle-shaped virus 1]ACZ35824.1 hypothetical protein [Acidianus spindle-shaped virus 1]
MPTGSNKYRYRKRLFPVPSTLSEFRIVWIRILMPSGKRNRRSHCILLLTVTFCELRLTLVLSNPVLMISFSISLECQIHLYLFQLRTGQTPYTQIFYFSSSQMAFVFAERKVLQFFRQFLFSLLPKSKILLSCLPLRICVKWQLLSILQHDHVAHPVHGGLLTRRSRVRIPAGPPH